MKQRFLILAVILTSLCCNSLFAQYFPYLEPRFLDEVVSFQMVASGKYLHHTPGTQNLGEQPATTNWLLEEFIMEETDEATWFRIKHLASGTYITTGGYNGALVTMENYSSSNSNAQKFQLIQQTISGRYKVHSKYQNAGIDLVLTNDYPDQGGSHIVYLSPNKTTGNDDNQKFDLNLIYPDEAPGSAIASLANRFEGKKVGISALFNGWELLGSTNHTRVYEQAPTPGIVDDEEWVIEYTDETGWYKIRNKLQNKYITVTSAVDDALVEIKSDAEYSDDYQKFKFVVQPEGDAVYKIYTKFSVGPVGARRGLVLDVPTTATIDIRLKKNMPTYGYNQKFRLTKDLPPAAEFTSGATPGTDVDHGKILGKQYHISGLESLAMLEPYVVGSDTFVRLQQQPVYGQQSEWTFDDGGQILQATGNHVRIRYGKTGQYLYIPVATQNSNIVPGMKLVLKKDLDSVQDRRYMFFIEADQLTNQFLLQTKIGPSFPYNNGQLKMDTDDNLVTDNFSTHPYQAERYFMINLSLPADDNFTYTIVSRSKGHLMSDSGIRREGASVVHAGYSDPTVNWHFISAGNGYYFIQNQLTGYYLTTRYADPLYNDDLNTSSSVITSEDSYKFKLIRNGNYFRIQNKLNNKYISTADDANDGGLVFMNFGPTDWAISRSDFFYDPLPHPVNAVNLLANYAPLPQNAFNNIAYRNKMVQNIGLPFEPTYQITQPVSILAFQAQGIDYNDVPSFYNVLRSALAWKFSYNTTQVDNAMRNYKLNEPGHRVQMVYALSSYMLEHLAALPNRASQWTHDEREVVGWVERSVKARHDAYANELAQSWLDFKITYGLEDELGFSVLLDGGGPNPADYHEPEYFNANYDQSLSFMEYAAICKKFDYKNPGALALLTVPSMVSSAGMLLGSVTLSETALESAELAADAARAAIDEAGELSSNVLRVGAQNLATEASATLRILKGVTSTSGASFILSVVAIASEILAMKITDGLAFEKYNQAISAKQNRLLNTPVNVNTMATSSNLLDQFYLCHDVDILLAAGKRFDYPEITATNPANVNVQCIAAIPPANPNVVTDEAGGCGTLTVSLQFEGNNGGAGSVANPYIITRVYRVADGCDNFLDVTQLLTAVDNINPTAGNPANVNVQCISAIPPANANVVINEADNCSTPIVTLQSEINNGGIGSLGNPYIVTRTYRVTDAAGNFKDVTQNLTAIDNIMPTASSPANIVVPCVGAIPLPDPAVITDEADNCGIPAVSFQSDTYHPGNPASVTRVYRVTDAAGNFADVTHTFLVIDYTSPAASVIQPTCSTGTGTINVTAPLGSGYSYSITGAGGTFQSSPTFFAVMPGSYTIYIKNSFGCVSAATTTVAVNLQPSIPGQPIVTGIVNVCPYIGTAEQITYQAVAAGNDLQTFNWTLPANVNLVSGAGTNSIVVTFPNPAFINQANKQIRVTASNQCGTSAQTIFYLLSQLPGTPKPVIASGAAVCTVIGTAVPIAYSIPKVAAATSYLWTAQDGTTAIVHPNGLGINDTTILVTFAAGFTTSTVNVAAVNDCGTSTQRSLTVIRTNPSTPSPITGSTNACPFITPNPAATYGVPPVAGITYNWGANNGGGILSGQGSGNVSVTFPNGYTSGIVSVTATNGCGTSSARTLAINTLHPVTPGVPDVQNISACPDRQYTYTLATFPSNTSQLIWTVPTSAGAVLINGQGTASITVSYPSTAVNGSVTVQAINPCAASVIRIVKVKLPECASARFARLPKQYADTTKTGHVETAIAGEWEVNIFPNPSVNNFSLEVNGDNPGKIEITLFDIAGKLLKKITGEVRQLYNFGYEWKAGIYLARIKYGTEEKTVRLVKLF